MSEFIKLVRQIMKTAKDSTYYTLSEISRKLKELKFEHDRGELITILRTLEQENEIFSGTFDGVIIYHARKVAIESIDMGEVLQRVKIAAKNYTRGILNYEETKTIVTEEFGQLFPITTAQAEGAIAWLIEEKTVVNSGR